MEKYDLDYFVSTGEMLKEYLTLYDMSQKELSLRIGISEKHMTEVLKSKVALTMDIAMGFEKVFNVKATSLLSYENGYREYLAKQKKMQELEETIDFSEISDKFDFKYLTEKEFIHKEAKPTEKINELLNFFGVNTINAIYSVYGSKILKFAYKQDGYQIEPLAVWLRVGEKMLQNEPQLPEFKEEMIDDLLADLKIITHFDVKDVCQLAKKICNKYGVYLIIVDATKNSKVRGATSYMGRNPMIQLSKRFKTHDIFVHSLFHEIMHLKYHLKRGKGLIELEDKTDNNVLLEKEADEKAANFILPNSVYCEFIQHWNKRQDEIIQFAKCYHIHPGIIVGRLQHDKFVDYKFYNKLKQII